MCMRTGMTMLRRGRKLERWIRERRGERVEHLERYRAWDGSYTWRRQVSVSEAFRVTAALEREATIALRDMMQRMVAAY